MNRKQKTLEELANELAQKRSWLRKAVNDFSEKIRSLPLEENDHETVVKIAELWDGIIWEYYLTPTGIVKIPDSIPLWTHDWDIVDTHDEPIAVIREIARNLPESTRKFSDKLQKEIDLINNFQRGKK